MAKDIFKGNVFKAGGRRFKMDSIWYIGHNVVSIDVVDEVGLFVKSTTPAKIIDGISEGKIIIIE